eukprot:scaffold923_cov171-Amphora_coffeaeformis.AAC.13
MGSGVSKPSSGGQSPPEKNFNETSFATAKPAADDKEASLSGMALVNYKCRKRKKVYDKCVSNWYSQEFLPGKSVDQEGACGELFENYRTCILKGIRKEIWDKQGLPPPNEGSPMDEVADE